MARRVKLGENETISSLAVKEGVSETTIELMNDTKKLTNLSTGDTLRLPEQEEPLPDIEEQEKINDKSKESLPDKVESGFVDSKKTNGVRRSIEGKNPSNFTSPKELDQKDETTNVNYLSDRIFDSLRSGLDSFNVPVKETDGSRVIKDALFELNAKENLNIDHDQDFYHSLLKVGESVRSTTDNLQQATANVPGNILDKAGSTIMPLIFGENHPAVETLNETVDTYMQFDEDYFKDAELPDKDERKEIVSDFIKKSSKFDNYTDQQSERLANRVAEETKAEINALQSKTGDFAGKVGEDLGTALAKIGIELGIFGGVTRAVPAIGPVTRFARAGLGSVAGGFVSGSLATSADNQEEAIRNGLTDAGINLGIDVAFPGTLALGSKGVKFFRENFNDGVRLLDRLRGFDQNNKIDEAMDHYKQAKKAYDEGNNAKVDELTSKFNESMAEADLKAETNVVNRIKRDFSNLLKTDTDFFEDAADRARQTELFDRAESDEILDNFELSKFLDYHFGEKKISNLDDQQLVKLDTYFSNLRHNEEYLEKAQENWRDVLDFKKDGLAIPDKEKEALKISEWYSHSNMLKDEDGNFGNKFMENMINGPAKAKGRGSEATSSLSEDQKDGLWESTMKAIGPTHVQFQNIAEETGVPIDIAFRDFQAKLNNSRNEFQRGVGEMMGIRGINDLFSRTGMWGDANKELKEDVTKFLRENEYDMSEVTEEALENSEYIVTEEQKTLAKEVRDWFQGMFEHTDVDESDFIKGYLYRPLKSEFDKSSKANAQEILEKGDIEELIPVLEQERKWGDLSPEELKKIENEILPDGVEVERDLQTLMTDYLWSVTRKRNVNPAVKQFRNQVDKLENLGSRHTTFAKDFVNRKAKLNNSGRVDPFNFIKNIGKTVDVMDKASGGRSVAGQKVREYFEQTDLPDMITSATYGANLMADQMFRIMNGSQNILTKARIGEENFQRAFFDPANNGRLINIVGDHSAPGKLLDDVIDKSNVRNSADQFMVGQKTNFAGNVSGKEADKGFLQSAIHNIFGFGNMTGSDRFNVRNSYYAGADTIDHYADDYLEGSMDWDGFVKNTKLHRSHDIIQKRIKKAMDEDRVGQMVNKETGERLRINEYLELGEEAIEKNNWTVDRKSAEAIYAFDTTWNTQWNYGPEAMGRLFWKEDKGGLGRTAQSLTLPFQTWWINMATQLKDMIIDNPANADQVVNMMTTGHAYADAVEQVFNEDAESYTGFSTLPSDPFNAPGAELVNATMGILTSELSETEKTGDNKHANLTSARGYDTLSRVLWGEGTAQRRAYDAFNKSLQIMSGGSVNKEDMRELLKDVTGADLEALDQDERVKKIREAYDRNF